MAAAKPTKKTKGLGMAQDASKWDAMERKMRRVEKANQQEMQEDLDMRRNQRARGMNPVWPSERREHYEFKVRQRQEQAEWDRQNRQRFSKGKASKGAPSFVNTMNVIGRPYREDIAWKANEAFKGARDSMPSQMHSELPEDYRQRRKEWEDYVRDEVQHYWELDPSVADDIFDVLEQRNPSDISF